MDGGGPNAAGEADGEVPGRHLGQVGRHLQGDGPTRCHDNHQSKTCQASDWFVLVYIDFENFCFFILTVFFFRKANQF